MTYNKIYALMDHERMRWRTMDYRKLVTRLTRITKEEKMYCFLILATETGNQKLFNAGVMRAGELGYNMDMDKVKSVAKETRVIQEKTKLEILKIAKGIEKRTADDLIKNAPKFVIPDEKKYNKPEEKYLNMFTKEELTRAIIL